MIKEVIRGRVTKETIVLMIIEYSIISLSRLYFSDNAKGVNATGIESSISIIGSRLMNLFKKIKKVGTIINFTKLSDKAW